MTGVTLICFFLNPYPYPSTLYPYREGYGFTMATQGYIYETHGFARCLQKPWVFWQNRVMLLLMSYMYYIFFIVTAATTLSKTMRPHHAHDPKHRKALIENGERELQAKGRR
jgi:hypothetical protein